MNTNRMGLEQESKMTDDNLRDLSAFLMDSYTGSLDTLRYAYAAEAINELLAHRKASEWIPISERFPDNETAILVADCEGVVWGAEVQDGTIYPDDWAYINRFGSREATHWKPMPEANQQKNDV